MEAALCSSVYARGGQRGIRLQLQVGVDGYRIDFGVRDAELPGRHLCGIECDGAAYHSSETARERLRVQVNRVFQHQAKSS
jgi:very-short-patch-repair endonuclease